MPVGSDSAGPSPGRHAVDRTPYTDTADRHRLLLEVSDRTYAECLVTVDALLNPLAPELLFLIFHTLYIKCE